MQAHRRYHIDTRPVPPPAGGYPAQFHLDDGGAYVKYGYQLFLGTSQRGADGAILRTAELVALGCIRIAQCAKGLGFPFGITTTDPMHALKIDADVGFQQIVNRYTSWLWQLAGILHVLGMRSIAELRSRSNLLVYLTG